jgi:hypothetical protein
MTKSENFQVDRKGVEHGLDINYFDSGYRKSLGAEPAESGGNENGRRQGLVDG